MGDAPRHDLDRLIIVLVTLRERVDMVFDGDAAREAYTTLPDRMTLYRGKVVVEDGREYGVCWTLDPERARWFATEHGRCRNTAFAARDAIGGGRAWRYVRAASSATKVKC
jgi:hypothetical protein